FFSSRSRHTRFSRDWSSDVCSSDLFLFSSFGPPRAGNQPFRACSSPSVFAGGYGGRATPDPIPNSVVKPSSANGTAGETLWESKVGRASCRERDGDVAADVV